MRLLGKSRKKYHGSIMKCYRSIIKDCTMHEKISLNSAKRLFKQRKDPKEYCPKISPIFGHSLLTLWAIVARYTGCQCPRGGLRMPVWRAQADQPEGIERPTDELKKQTHHHDLSWLYWHNHRTSTGEIGLKKPMRLPWYINETSQLKNQEVSFLLLSYISSI